jgi:hypothetical protein
MPVRVTTSGPIFEGRFPEIFGQAFRQGASRQGRDILQGLIAESPLYRGDWRRGFGLTFEGSGTRTSLIWFNDADDAQWVDQGRGPGKFPPPDVMLTWVLARRLAEQNIMTATYKASNIGRGLKLSNSAKPKRLRDPLAEARSIAYLIGRKISRQGLPGFHMYDRINTGYDLLIDFMTDDISSRLAQLLNAT